MYRVEIEHKQEMAFAARSPGYEFSIDVKGKGVTPPDALLASLGSCIGVYIRKYAEGAKLSLENFKITVEAELSNPTGIGLPNPTGVDLPKPFKEGSKPYKEGPKEAPVCFKEIRVLVDFKGAQIEERRRQALLGFIKNCPVHNTLEARPNIVISAV